MVLFIENPNAEKEDGKIFTLAYEIPRNTSRIDVVTIQPRQDAQWLASSSNAQRLEFSKNQLPRLELTCHLKDGGQKIITEHKQRPWHDSLNQQKSTCSSCEIFKWAIGSLLGSGGLAAIVIFALKETVLKSIDAATGNSTIS